MFGGAYYIWIMAAFFGGCGGLLLILGAILFLGYWFEKRRTGAKHGFLELPEELRSGNTPAEKPAEAPGKDAEGR